MCHVNVVHVDKDFNKLCIAPGFRGTLVMEFRQPSGFEKVKPGKARL